MMLYHYRIFDRYQKTVISIAILTDKNRKWRPDRFLNEAYGCRFEMQFLTLKIIDFRNRKQELEQSNNPFCMVILAHLAAMEKYPDTRVKLFTKIKLTRMLYEKGWSKDQVLDLYQFLDSLLTLPETLTIAYHHEIHEIERKNHMEYITTAERIGIQKGIQRGELLLLIKQIRIKFKFLPVTYRSQLEKADQETILKIAERILNAKTLEELFV